MKIHQQIFLSAVAVIIMFSSCEMANKNYVPVARDAFQIMHDGKQIDLFTMQNSNGMIVQITNYGGKIVSIIVPDREGNMGDVCLGYESAEEYIQGIASLGATMGRFANRIANAQFTLNDSTYHLVPTKLQLFKYGFGVTCKLAVLSETVIDRAKRSKFSTPVGLLPMKYNF